MRKNWSGSVGVLCKVCVGASAKSSSGSGQTFSRATFSSTCSLRSFNFTLLDLLESTND